MAELISVTISIAGLGVSIFSNSKKLGIAISALGVADSLGLVKPLFPQYRPGIKGVDMGMDELTWDKIKDVQLFPPPNPALEYPNCLFPDGNFPKELSDFKDIQLLYQPRDPLILDLNRDGQLALQNAAFFDLNANGFHEYTSWISETDAFLILDKNFNGLIDDGSEMFGDAMILPDGSRALAGFDALRAYDSDDDGKTAGCSLMRSLISLFIKFLKPRCVSIGCLIFSNTERSPPILHNDY